MSAYLPTTELQSVDAGTAQHRFVTYQPDASVINGNFGANPVQFRAQVSGEEWVDLSESYISFGCHPIAGDGATVINAGQLAPARWGLANIFRQVECRFADQVVELVNTPSQQEFVTGLLTTEPSHDETVGTLTARAKQSLVRGEMFDTALRPVYHWHPALGSWSTGKLIRGLNITMILTPDVAWKTRLCETIAGAFLATGAGAGNLDVIVDSMEMHLSLYRPKMPIPVSPQDIIDTDVYRVFTQQIAAADTGSQVAVAIDSSAYELITFFQRTDAGTQTDRPLNEAEQSNLTSISFDYDGQRLPRTPYAFNMATGAGLDRAYAAFIEASTARSSKRGAAYTYGEFHVGPVFCQKLLKALGHAPTQVTVEYRRSGAVATAQNLYVVSVCPLRIVLNYNERGEVVGAIPTRADSETEAALM